MSYGFECEKVPAGTMRPRRRPQAQRILDAPTPITLDHTHGMHAHSVLALQRQVGNRAVGVLLQRCAVQPSGKVVDDGCGCSQDSGDDQSARPVPVPVQRACPPTPTGIGRTESAESCATRGAETVSGSLLYFCRDSTELLDAGQERLLEQVITDAKTSARTEVHGNASKEGNPVYNTNLSCKRAAAIAGRLRSAGVGAPISVVSHGPTDAYGPQPLNRNVVVSTTPHPSVPAEPPAPTKEPPREPSEARDRQVACVKRLGGCPETRPGGLPSPEEITRYNEQCRVETGYEGVDVTPSADECAPSPPAGPASAPVFRVTTSGCEQSPYQRDRVLQAARAAFDKVASTNCVKSESLREAILARFDGLHISCEREGSDCGSARRYFNDTVKLYPPALEASCGPLESTILHEVVHMTEWALFGHGDLAGACEASRYGFGAGDPDKCR